MSVRTTLHGPQRYGPHPKFPFQDLAVGEVLAIKPADHKLARRLIRQMNFAYKGHRNWNVIEDQHGMRVKRML